MNKISLSLTIAALLMVGCNEKPQESNSATEAPKQVETAAAVEKEEAVPNLYGTTAIAPVAAHAPEGADIQANAPHVATVLETANAAGYTYVKVDEDGNSYWIAGPQTNITVGSKISYIEQMVMQDFTSKALSKTFDYLMFVTTIIPADGSAHTAAAPAAKEHDCDSCGPTADAKAAAANAAPHPVVPVVEASTPIAVEKLANGHTIEELFAQKDDLNGTTVTFNAQVVKVSKNIMGKDWVHLQDGSGAAGSNDLTATGLNTTVSVGDVVTVKGTLKTDVDFGYGYFFPVILEESQFKTN